MEVSGIKNGTFSGFFVSKKIFTKLASLYGGAAWGSRLVAKGVLKVAAGCTLSTEVLLSEMATIPSIRPTIHPYRSSPDPTPSG